MRYESFYPFSQGRNTGGGGGFLNFTGGPQVPQSPPAGNFFGGQGNFFGGQGNFSAPTPPPNQGGGFLSNLVSQMQPNSPAGNFLGNLGNMSGRMQGNPLGGFPQGGPGPGPVAGVGAQGPSRAMSYLQTADKFLNTAQQLTPMVRQYAPMIQNVPALLKLYRGFQSIPSATTATNASTAAVSNASTRAAANSVARATSSATNGASLPRIFQPPL